MLAFLKEYLNESLISKNFIHSFTAIIREKTEISKGLCAISNDKKYQYPSNKQYTLNKIPGSKKSQNKRRLKLEEEMKPYLHEFKVEKKKQSLKIKHLKETRFNLRQQENIMDLSSQCWTTLPNLSEI
ncbi:22812_t:CDS:1 [Gigaspora rosea]|nr:22812_t:CDS:1 [Gigaspora rosea]